MLFMLTLGSTYNGHNNRNNRQYFILGTVGRRETFAFRIIDIIDCVVNTHFDDYWEIK